jgi:RNA polymerase sigma factor (sigma-70 family)
MTNPCPDFKALLDRIKQGDDYAADEFHRHYSGTLRRIVRLRLQYFPQMKPVCDDDDVTQDAWMSAFLLIRQGRSFKTEEKLLAFLKQIARRKTVKVIREYLGTAKRDLCRSQSAEASTAVKSILAGPAPGPAERAEIKDLMERALRSLLFKDRLILQMHIQGHLLPEIAASIGCCDRTVSRSLTRILSELALPAQVR